MVYWKSSELQKRIARTENCAPKSPSLFFPSLSCHPSLGSHVQSNSNKIFLERSLQAIGLVCSCAPFLANCPWSPSWRNTMKFRFLQNILPPIHHHPSSSRQLTLNGGKVQAWGGSWQPGCSTRPWIRVNRCPLWQAFCRLVLLNKQDEISGYLSCTLLFSNSALLYCDPSRVVWKVRWWLNRLK